MARIRPMGSRDLHEVARLHRAMGSSLWGSLGPRFVSRVYEALLDHTDFLGFVYEEEGRVRGFIAGTSHGTRMFRQTALRHGPSLALATVVALASRPRALLPLLETAAYFRRSAPSSAGERIHAESLFCSFDGGIKARRAAGLINKVLFDTLARQGHHQVKITTEASNPFTARQLLSWGFVVLGRFEFYGKAMILWRLDLDYCERVSSS